MNRMFKQLDKLAGAASNAMAFYQDVEARKRAQAIQEQRIRAEQAFKLKLQADQNKAAYGREKMRQDYQERTADADRSFDYFELAQRKKSDDAKMRLDMERNSLLRTGNKDLKTSQQLLNLSKITEIMYGPKERTLSAEIRALQERASEYGTDMSTEILYKTGQLNKILAEKANFARSSMQNIDPLFNFPETQSEILGRDVIRFEKANEGRFGPPVMVTPDNQEVNIFENPYGRGDDVGRTNYKQQSNNLNTKFTVTGDSSKMSLGKKGGIREKAIELLKKNNKQVTEQSIKIVMEALNAQ